VNIFAAFGPQRTSDVKPTRDLFSSSVGYCT